MAEENVNQELKLKDIDESRKDLTEEINQNDLMSKNHKKVCMALNYTEQSLLSVSTITGSVLISAFDSLVGISIGIARSTVGLEIFVITAGIKKYKLIIKKEKGMIK